MSSSSDLARRVIRPIRSGAAVPVAGDGSAPRPLRSGAAVPIAGDGSAPRPIRSGASLARFDEQFADPSKDRRGYATPEQAWMSGYDVGMEQGVSVGRAAMVAEDAASDRRMAAIGHALRVATESAVANVQHEFELATEALVRASFDLALAVLGRDLRDNPRTGEEALRSALTLVPPRIACVARLHPSDVADLASLDPATLHPDLSIVADYSVDSGDCIMDLPTAQIENRLAEAIARVRSVLGVGNADLGELA